MKKIVFVDMDDTIADFGNSEKFSHIRVLSQDEVTAMYEPGFFLNLKPVDGALKAVRDIIRMGYDVHILTQPLAESAHCYQEKIQWLGLWFPELVNKVTMTQDKGLVRGDFLIDDNAKKWKDKFEAGGGKFIHFNYNRRDPTSNSNRAVWERIVYFLMEETLREGSNGEPGE